MPQAASVPLVMYGARSAMAAGLVHIEEQVNRVEQAVAESSGRAFELAKTLIESACKAILTERGVGHAATDDLPKLFEEVSRVLPFLPAEASDTFKARKRLAQTLSCLSTAVQGVCELRNACGFLPRLRWTEAHHGGSAGGARCCHSRRDCRIPSPGSYVGPHAAFAPSCGLRFKHGVQRPCGRGARRDPDLRIAL